MVAIPCFECHYAFGHTATCSKYVGNNPPTSQTDFSKEIMSLTPREDKATLFYASNCEAALEVTRKSFPDSDLAIEPRGEKYFVVVCNHPRVKRWLRV